MAKAHVISDAVTEVLQRGDGGCPAVSALRGEFCFHLAELWEQLAEIECVDSEKARGVAESYRVRGRALLGGVG